MNDSDKSILFHIMQNAVPAASNEKISIESCSPYRVVDGTSGIKFTAKKSDISIQFFIGFTNDSKYSDSLVFGILKSETDETIIKLNLDEDSNGNKIQERRYQAGGPAVFRRDEPEYRLCFLRKDGSRKDHIHKGCL